MTLYIDTTTITRHHRLPEPRTPLEELLDAIDDADTDAYNNDDYRPCAEAWRRVVKAAGRVQ